MHYILLIFSLIACYPATMQVYSWVPTCSTTVSKQRPIKSKLKTKKKKHFFKKKFKKEPKKLAKHRKAQLVGGIFMLIFGILFILFSLLLLIAFFYNSEIIIWVLLFFLASLALLISGILLLIAYRKFKKSAVYNPVSSNKIDSIHLKDGSIITGTILEINHPKSIKIELEGKRILLIEYDKIEKVTTK